MASACLVAALFGCHGDRYILAVHTGEMSFRVTDSASMVIVDAIRDESDDISAGCDAPRYKHVVYDSGPVFEGIWFCQSDAIVASECWRQAMVTLSSEPGLGLNVLADSGDLADHPDLSIHAYNVEGLPLGPAGSTSLSVELSRGCVPTGAVAPYTLDVDWTFDEVEVTTVRSSPSLAGSLW